MEIDREADVVVGNRDPLFTGPAIGDGPPVTSVAYQLELLVGTPRVIDAQRIC